MDVLKKAVRRSPNIFKAKHKKLGEGWAENQDTVSDGITFYLKHLGSTLVEELKDGESYSGSPSAKAVATIVSMAKSAGKKLRKVSLCVSYKGVKVVDLITQESVLDVTIYRISFCTADKHHDKVFAFMSRNKVNETVECNAFLCAKPKIAQAVTLTVSQAFNLAKEVTESKAKTRHRSQSEGADTEQMNSESKNDLFTSSLNQESSTQVTYTPVLQQSSTTLNTNNNSANTWETFDESPTKCDTVSSIWEDDFSRLAEDRLRPPLPAFATDIFQDDLDPSVQMYQNDPNLCLEELNRTLSVDDLLNL